jgi:hypothetical protein
MTPKWSLHAKVSLAFVALFCGAMLGAVASYAGGSWLHPHAAGFSLLENFWCDLLREPAHDGLPNGRSVALATLGFAAISLALGPYWLEVASLLPPRRAWFVRRAGLASALATALVALLPSDRFPGAHAPAVLTAGGLGFGCGCVCGAWALGHFRAVRAFALTSLFLLCAASVNLVLYVAVAYFQAPDTVVLPAAQKLATLGLVGWMIAGLAAARAGASARRPKP